MYKGVRLGRSWPSLTLHKQGPHDTRTPVLYYLFLIPCERVVNMTFYHYYWFETTNQCASLNTLESSYLRKETFVNSTFLLLNADPIHYGNLITLIVLQFISYENQLSSTSNCHTRYNTIQANLYLEFNMIYKFWLHMVENILIASGSDIIYHKNNSNK